MATLTFAKTDDTYVSSTMIPNGNTMIEVTFEPQTYEGKESMEIILEQSLGGVSWKPFYKGRTNEVFSKVVEGIVEGMSIRMRTKKTPISGSYVQN